MKKPIVNFLEPSQEQLNTLLGYYQTGRYADAEKLSLSITQEFPEHQFAWKVLAAVFKQTGRINESLIISQKSVQLFPQDAEAHNNLGVVLQQQGSLKEAEASYRKAITLRPNYAEAYFKLGNILKQQGSLKKAEASYDQAIILKHDFIDALEHRWKLLFDQKRYEGALKDADLLISKRSRAFDLTTLYALGRIEEIYKRIETHSKIDGENLRIAAFAAFVAELEKKPTAYNFCPNPMNFIHISNISSHLKNSAKFVKEVIGELNNVKTNWEPNDRTARKGFVTDQKFNLFGSSSGKLAQLKSIIFNEINAYYLKFKEEKCSYIKKWPSEIFLYGWHVVLKQQGYNTAHIHASGWLSGVIYLKVVPALGKNEGAIEFSLNGEDYHHKDSTSMIFQPEEGDIVFFPSSLHHRTIPFSTDTDRIIISFDLMPEAAKR